MLAKTVIKRFRRLNRNFLNLSDTNALRMAWPSPPGSTGMQLTTKFVLASESPRRRQLLTQIGVPFKVVPSSIDEVLPRGSHPSAAVQTVALDKARAVSARFPGALTLGADTIVVHEGRVLGKPRDPDHARSMLRRLSGNTHTVYTGLALVHPCSAREATASEGTRVTFASLSDAEIDAYVATGAPMDKAGAYGIQHDMGSLFVTRIEGDYFNVVGLPLYRLYAMLREKFVDLIVL